MLLAQTAIIVCGPWFLSGPALLPSPEGTCFEFTPDNGAPVITLQECEREIGDILVEVIGMVPKPNVVVVAECVQVESEQGG